METGQRYSPIADSFASRLKWISGRPPREHVKIGIILLVFGVVAFGISPWLAWFTVASGLLLLTWHSRMQGMWRGLLYFFALLPVLHWFNSINEFLFHEDAVTGLLLARDRASPLEVGSGLIIAVAACVGLVAVIRHRPRANGVALAGAKPGAGKAAPVQWSNIPAHTFADVGGMDTEKRRIDVKADLKKRMKGWKPPKPNYTWGVLAKYAATVSSASEGAVTIPVGLTNGGANGHQAVLGKGRKTQSARR